MHGPNSRCHYLVINKDISNESIELGKKTLHTEAKQRLLGIIVDKDLNFQIHAKLIIKISKHNLSARIRVAPLMTDFNKRVTFNSFIKEQFHYCLLLWMFSTRAVNHKINRLHERGLRALLNYKTSKFNEMLSKSNNTAIYVKIVKNLPNPKTKKYKTDTIAYKAAQRWSMLPIRHENFSSVDLFKSKIKNWHCNDCPCNIC